MKIKMDLAKILENLKQDERFRANIEHWKVIPPREAATVPFPDDLDPRIRGLWREEGFLPCTPIRRRLFVMPAKASTS